MIGSDDVTAPSQALWSLGDQGRRYWSGASRFCQASTQTPVDGPAHSQDSPASDRRQHHDAGRLCVSACVILTTPSSPSDTVNTVALKVMCCHCFSYTFPISFTINIFNICMTDDNGAISE